jgi:predicted outer membrane repeat protein
MSTVRFALRITLGLGLALAVACGAPSEEPDGGTGPQPDAGDAPDGGGEQPDGGGDEPDGGGGSADCASGGRAVTFTTAGNVSTDLSEAFAAGTREAPHEHTIGEPGTLSFCGTWSARITVDAEATVEGSGNAKLDVDGLAVDVKSGRTASLRNFAVENDGRTALRVTTGRIEANDLSLTTRLTSNNGNILVMLVGGEVNARFRRTTIDNAAIAFGMMNTAQQPSGSLTLDEVTVRDAYMWAVSGSPGELVVRSSRFERIENDAFSAGGTIEVEDSVFDDVSNGLNATRATVTLRRSTFTGGGVARLGECGPVEIEDVTATGQTKYDAPFVQGNGPSGGITLRRVTLKGYRGGLGTVFCDNCGALTILDSRLEDHEAVAGAIEYRGPIDAAPLLTVRGTTFLNNRATGDQNWHGGGAILLTRASLLVENSTFTGNRGYGGGAIRAAAADTGSIVIRNSTFSSNEATGGDGGAVLAYSPNVAGALTLKDLTFTGNTAAKRGGGMLASGVSPVLEALAFSGNSAQDGGGAFLMGQGLLLKGGSFVRNAATRYGGGFGASHRVVLDGASFGDGADENTPHDYGNGNSSGGVWAGVDLDGTYTGYACENAQCVLME